jgi:hypothetical protein
MHELGVEILLGLQQKSSTTFKRAGRPQSKEDVVLAMESMQFTTARTSVIIIDSLPHQIKK